MKIVRELVFKFTVYYANTTIDDNDEETIIALAEKCNLVFKDEGITSSNESMAGVHARFLEFEAYTNEDADTFALDLRRLAEHHSW